MSKLFPEHEESRALEDAAWRLKDLAADTNARVMSAPLRSALQRATRDVQRVYEGLHAELHKRKRAKDEEPAEPAPPPNGAATRGDFDPDNNGVAWKPFEERTDAQGEQQEIGAVDG